MKRLVLALCTAALLASCASNKAVSEAELQINEIADESSRRARFPVLGPLPSRQDVVGEGIPAEAAAELRSAASALSELKLAAASPRPSLSTEETVRELRTLVAELRTNPPQPRPAVDVEALGFPTPPPLN